MRSLTTILFPVDDRPSIRKIIQVKIRYFLILGIYAFGLTASLHAQQVPVVEKTLSNGMRILLVPRKDEATVAGGWVAHVGSSNEKPGITGIAHLFEHMMFKGTPTIGTKDYAKDQKIIAEQEAVRDEMRAEEAKSRVAFRKGDIDCLPHQIDERRMHDESAEGYAQRLASAKDRKADITDLLQPENMTPRWRELKKKFDELVKEQREILVKSEFDSIYTSAGGMHMNAFTTEDMTAYFISVPANKLELWMWMESERLLHPVFREFYAERDVVFEERRMRTDSTPLGKFSEEFNAMFWQSSAYHWPVIGWPSDIPAISKKQADEFYSIYYAPQNITPILVGDFDVATTEAMAEKYFGRIPAGTKAPPDVVTIESNQEAEKRMNAEAEANPQVDILWHTAPFGHKDSYVLDVLSELLSTRTGRLYKGLVLGSQVANDVSAGIDSRKWAGAFEISGEAKDGRTPEELEKGIYAELDKLKKDDVPPDELQKVKNNFAAAEYRKLTGNMGILMNLIQNEWEGDWHEINDSAKHIQAVTAADIKRVVTQYFKKENRAVAIYTRKAATAATKEETK